LTGAGLISSDGGAGGGPDNKKGGGGGGGRLAVYYDASTFTGDMSAVGGLGYEYGGAGTVFTKSAAQSAGSLIIDNAGSSGALSPLADGTHTFDTVVVRNEAQAEIPNTATVTVLGHMTVESNGHTAVSGELIGGDLSVRDSGQVAVTSEAALANFGDVTVEDNGELTFDAVMEAQEVTIASGGIFALNTSGTASSVDVLSGGVLTHTAGQSAFDLTVTGDVTVALGGSITADGKGHSADSGPGAGEHDTVGNWPAYGGGAGYGGVGGISSRLQAGGATYGSITEPVDLGSGGGGGTNWGGPADGGAGGGAIRLTVGGTLTLEGSVTSDGAEGATIGNRAGGGGSGGSVYLAVGTLAGGGLISADGGAGGGPDNTKGGGGGGGRLAVYYDASTFTGDMSAAGGFGYEYGGAGTVFTKSAAQSAGSLIIDNAGNSGAPTPLPDVTHTFDTVVVRNDAHAEVPVNCIVVADGLTLPNAADLTMNGGMDAGQVDVESGAILFWNSSGRVDNMHIASGAALTHSPEQSGFHLTVTDDLTVDSGGSITADGTGYGAANGPGAGGSLVVDWASAFAGGGGYGGEGGRSGARGGSTYGSPHEPVDLGSGGGNATNRYRTEDGGAGGGAVRLTVGGTFTLEGTLTANGMAGHWGGLSLPAAGGGGSGGSVYVTADTITGSGTVSADGGDGGKDGRAGGGGGGRIGIYYLDASAFGFNVAVTGGAGRNPGEQGTVFLAGPDAAPFVSSGTSPTGHQNAPIDHSDIVFTRAIAPETFAESDVQLTGPNGQIAISDISLLEDIAGRQTYRLSFPLQTTNGRYRLFVGPDIIGTNGLLLDQDHDGVGGEIFDDVFEATFTIDTVGLRINRHDPSGDVAGTADHVDVWFSESTNAATFTTADVSISGPQGNITPAAVSEIGLNQFRIGFAPQSAAGVYHVVVGPDIQDPTGNRMDQDRDGSLGEPTDDVYQASFNLVLEPV